MHNGTTIDELLHICGMDRCSYITAEFRGDTQEAKLVHCDNPPTWMGPDGDVFCDCHPSPDDAEKAKAILKMIDCAKDEIRWVKSLGEA